jgi:phosphopantothenoylcysteine decarboxylase/phosphopantothenate--cysteine ligase
MTSPGAPPPLPPAPLPPPTTRRGAQSRRERDRASQPARKPTVVLGVTGSIAAYKAAEVARLLVKGGARVIPVLTRSATEFVGAQTFSGLTGERVHVSMWDAPGELHVSLASEADLVLVVPATADFLARLADGRADDLLAATVLCARGPVMVAPAMHPRMWSHPAVQRNVATLASDARVELVGPVEGEVASGDVGMGRMADPAHIAERALARVGPRDLEPLHVVVTAGPTCEDLDPVRFLGNRSTGKMGFAIAQRAARRGAFVTLIAGPVQLPTPAGVKRIDVRSALEMQAALRTALGEGFGEADILVMSAAVGDYRPARTSSTKLKRSAEPSTLELAPNPDLLADIGSRRRGREPVLVGFAVETETPDRLVANALGKLQAKRVDLVVANHASDSFGRDDNVVTLVSTSGAETLPRTDKGKLADRILDRALELLPR